MILFVDTHSMLRAQNGELEVEDIAPIIVHDEVASTFERTRAVKITGEAELVFDFAPEHNLARVWVQADRDSLIYDGEPTEWVTKR